MTQILEERISDIKSVAKSHRRNVHILVDDAVVLLNHLERAIKIISELQQKNDLLQLDFNAAQEIMGGMNKEIEELKEKLKKYENV
jgi:hypothetical protein